MRIRISVLLLVSLIATLITTIATMADPLRGKFSVADIDDAGEVQTFLFNLQEGLRAHDIQAVSRMVHIPIEVATDRGVIDVESEGDLKKNFDLIFDESVAKTILCQKFDELGVTYLGVLIGRGVVYFGHSFHGRPEEFNWEKDSNNFTDRDVWPMKITAINGGPPAHAAAAACQD